MQKLKINSTNVHCSILKEHIQIQVQLIGGDIIEADFAVVTNKEGQLDGMGDVYFSKIISSAEEPGILPVYETEDEIADYFDKMHLNISKVQEEITKQFIEAKGYDKPENQTEKYKFEQKMQRDPITTIFGMILGSGGMGMQRPVNHGHNDLVN